MQQWTPTVLAVVIVLATGCTTTNPRPSTVQCVVSGGVFTNGFNGSCTARAPQDFEMVFRDDEGTELLRFEWPGGQDRPPTDCASLCEASVFHWAHTRPDLLVSRAPSPATFATCDGGAFDCLGVCGPECAATIQFPIGPCGPNGQCILTEFRGYTKVCCLNHDICFTTARSLADHIGCAIIAVSEGCELRDAWGGGSGSAYVERACLEP